MRSTRLGRRVPRAVKYATKRALHKAIEEITDDGAIAANRGTPD